jgi:hypothetical protein
MHTQIKTVTPDEAAEMLSKNTRNRPLRPSHVRKLAREMTAGRFKLTHQGIAFNCDGTLLDGQHRLAAIVMAGTPQVLMVTTGVDSGAVMVIDEHAKRTPFDGMLIADGVPEGVKRMYTTIANAMANCGNDRELASNIESKLVLRDFLVKHYEAITFSYDACLSHGTKRGITQASVIAVVARAWYTAERDRLRQFGDILYTGMATSQKDRAAITLRNYLLNDPPIGSAGRLVVYKKTERALRAFLDEQQLTKCTIAERELFPIPGEKIEDGK